MPDNEPEPSGKSPDPQETGRLYFNLLNEIGIIAQLTRAMFEQVNRGAVSLPQFSVLNHMVRLGDGQTPQELARAFQVPKASMTNTLQGLERMGLIATRPHARDGRSKIVAITNAGREMREACISRLGPEIAKLAGDYPPEAVVQITPDLAKLRMLLDRMRD